MKTLVVISCLVLTVVARPGGYSYHAPTGGALSANLSPPLSSYSSGHSLGLAPLSSHGSLGLSSYSSGGSVALGSSYSVSPAVYAALATSGLSSPHSGSTTYYISSTGHSAHAPATSTAYQSYAPSYSTSFIPSSASSSYSGLSSLSSGQSFGSSSLSSGGASFGSGLSSLSSGQSFGSASSSSGGASSSLSSGASLSSSGPAFIPSQPIPFVPSQPSAQAVVQKHIYVHVPPPSEEDELAQPAPLLPPPIAQKHYKIIFIKAPSQPSVSKQILQQQLQQTQAEEKTLVYVLVKKPEDSLSEIRSIQPPPPTPPSKPEVYFIKYKASKEESQSVPAAQSVFEPLPLSSGPIIAAPSISSENDANLSVATASDSFSASDAASGPSLISAPSAVSISSSGESSSENILNLGHSETISSIIQPRTPAPEYLPAKHK